MWTEEVKNSLYQGLTEQLDNKTFYNTSSLYQASPVSTSASTISSTITDNFVSVGHISFSPETPNTSFSNTSIKGMSFANRVETDNKVTSVKDLSQNERKIYKIEDLLSANFAETTVIPLNSIPQNLSLVKRFEWKDVLFADVGEAFSMIKQRFFK